MTTDDPGKAELLKLLGGVMKDLDKYTITYGMKKTKWGYLRAIELSGGGLDGNVIIWDWGAGNNLSIAREGLEGLYGDKIG